MTSVMQDFEPHQADVYRWAYRILGSHHDAADVVQDVFIRWRYPARGSSAERPHTPRAWLRRVTINRCLELIRRRRVANAAAAEAGTSRVSGERADAATLRADLAEALRELSDRQRAVLVAKVFDRMTFVRIAEEIGCAVPTVKTHYLRALAVLRDRLDARWGDES